MNIIKTSFAFFFMYLMVNDTSAQIEKPLIQFGLMADIQYADCEPGKTRFYRNSLKKVEESVTCLNNRNVLFTVNLGDMIDRSFTDFEPVLIRLKQLNNKLYNLPGNHDYKEVTDNNALYEKLDMPSAYYSFKKKNWAFIFLNTNEVATYANIAGTEYEQEHSAMLNHIKSAGSKQGASYNGGIGSRQLAWLNKLLAKNQKAGNRVLIFTHHPLYPPSGFTALNDKQILDVIGNYSCVKAIFSGHHHSGAFGYFKGIPVITVEGMVETETENSFGIVKLYEDRIVLEGKGRMTSREFK